MLSLLFLCLAAAWVRGLPSSDSIVACDLDWISLLEVECPALPPRVPEGFNQVGSDGEDSPGNDIISYDIDADACAVMCEEEDACVGFVYIDSPDDSDSCWLKNKLVSTVPKPLSYVFKKDIEEIPQWEIRLQDGPDRCNGRAEVFLDDQWGTICAKGVYLKGWAWVFCKDLGCGKVLDKHFARELGKEVDDSIPIHVKGPKCNGNRLDQFELCTIANEINCGHDKDVWLKCENPEEP